MTNEKILAMLSLISHLSLVIILLVNIPNNMVEYSYNNNY